MKKIKVLFADDDELTRMEIARRVEAEGWTPVEAVDGEEAWNKFRQEAPDVVVLDMDMPRKNGVEVLKLIRSADGGVPVIVYSALAEEKNLLAGYDNGAKVYIVKNNNLFCLVPQIKAILGENSRRIFRLTEDMTFDADRNVFMVGKRCVSLCPLDGRIFTLLCENRNRLVTRDAFLEAGWDTTEVRWEQQLNKAVCRIRKLLVAVEDIDIKTETGRGYRLYIPSSDI